MTVAEALTSARTRLTEAGVAEPGREAASLLGHALDRPHAFLIAHPEYTLSPSEAELFQSVLSRRSAREPFQYITGKQEFWGLEFNVAPGVLIPRPETEVLVEAAIEFLKPIRHPRFVEAGVGTGCVSISLLHSIRNASAVATDLSDTALELASANAEKFGVRDRLLLEKADLFSGIAGEFDLVVSNPPYIPDADVEDLQPEVRDHEPHTALAGGEDGLDIVRRILSEVRHILRAGGVLMLEIGAGQAGAVTGMFDQDVWEQPSVRYDLQSIARVVFARLR